MSTSRLQPFGPEIWLADGGQAQVAGFRYPTRMALIRLTGGELLAWSPVALDGDLAAELADLGEVHSLVAPNALSLAVLLLGEALIQLQVRFEEAHLERIEGEAYRAYRARVPRWL